MRRFIFRMRDAYGDDYDYVVEAETLIEADRIATRECDDAGVSHLIKCEEIPDGKESS